MLATGRIADQALAPALTKARGARLWSVLSRDPERGAQFAEHHGAASPTPAYDDLDALLADPELDGVIIATPDRLHAQQTIACARAGKHVLCEKPLATTLEESEAMTSACKRAGVTLAVAYHMRWHRGHRQLAAEFNAGKYGEIRHMRVQWPSLAADSSNWRASADVGKWWSLAGVGTHCLDQVRWFMTPQAGEITKLASVINNSVWRSPHDETAVLAIQFENGATAEICSSVVFAGPRRMEVYGSQGYAICEETLGPTGGGTITVSGEPYEFEVCDPYVGEIEDFVDAVNEQRRPEVDGVEGTRNVELLLQAFDAD
jgi:1,5-anhydro-D-fructose reductase (1,5-anhydro-D-mannitol-forming)